MKPVDFAQGKGTVENRELISTELDKTLIVEAAAGTGKTTELVKRIVVLIQNQRATIGQIVAVTFSEKAAGELKLRLREELERAREQQAAGSDAARLLDAAVHDFEEAHVSTIHGFCAELLRERPVEARVDPAFAVLTDSQAERLFQEAFASWLHVQLANPQEGVRRSLRRPVKRQFGDEAEDGPIERLRAAAHSLREWRDHPAPWRRPVYDRTASIKALIARLKTFVDLVSKPIKRDDRLAESFSLARITSTDIERQRRMVGDMVPEAMWDAWEAALTGLAGDSDFANLKRGKGYGAAYAMGLTRDQAIAAHGDLLAELREFKRMADADLAALLHEEMLECLRAYEERKRESGALDFLDLLIKARDLVRDNEEIRREFRGRFRAILVDEFQDTDPLQADLLRLLAGSDTGALRPGALFIVGDPKQSIYRFRRADVGAYRRIATNLNASGAIPVTLQTSYRSVPAIQHFVNAAFREEMNGDPDTLQADYVPLLRHRPDLPEQPAIVALPVPRPYGKYMYGPPQVTQAALNQSQPPAIAAFVAWLLSPQCTWTVGSDNQRRKIVASDICLLFRRFMNFGRDITRGYVECLEARGIPHLLVGGKTFHEREEVDAVRTALTAIEWPEDELSVYAALHGPLFAIGEEELLEYHAIAHVFHPYRIPIDLPDRLKPIAHVLRTLRELHAARNHRTVAETIGRLMAATRAHAGFVLWRGGEQALANVLHISDLARRYEAEGGLSFRGFVDTLQDLSASAESPEAPILEEGSNGVRLMTVHKAKGLEFPVVVLADIACKLSLEEASRYLDAENNLCAVRLGGWSPLDLQEHNDEEARRDEAEGVRLAYVAATRARDVLVVPAVGDGPYNKGWIRPLNRALYPPRSQWQSPETARGVPLFKGKQTIMPDARADGQPVDETVRPGTYHFIDPGSGESYSVVWWDPRELEGTSDDARGVRREDLISKDAKAADIAADRRRYDEWRERLKATQQTGRTASMQIATATEITKDAGPVQPAANVLVEDAAQLAAPRPSGKRFGTLVHALLATLPLDAEPSAAADLAALYAKLFAAPDAERDAAAAIGATLVKHARWRAAKAAADAGRRVWREAPVSLRVQQEPGAPITIVDGQVDLAYETDAGWVVVDFKTDIEIVSAQDAYKQQVALYAEAVAKATGRPAQGVLLRV
ncbi:MAG TPA: UvrD-helicase domain-containing protein [Vicinamibacterales bacterium]|nr:UvrD-helicase domain-containing protein [Vicinamibacterales bacterium]